LEKALDLESGKPHQKNLWQNLVRWSVALRQCAHGRPDVPWEHVKNVRGPCTEFADALRGCAVFNLDDTIPKALGDGRRPTTKWLQFREMALERRAVQIPRILCAVGEDREQAERQPSVLVCCGYGVCSLFRTLLVQTGVEVKELNGSESNGFGLRLASSGQLMPVLDWRHPSARMAPKRMFIELIERYRPVAAECGLGRLGT
jgi:hypothetical protein